jgi:transposase
MANSTTISAGIDTSKNKLDAAIHGRDGTICVSNDQAGWKSLADHFAAAGVRRIGIEATGGYERGVTRYLQKAGFIVRLLQPLQVKAFAQARLRRAKSDQLDAHLIAACVHLIGEHDRMPPDPRFDALADHLTFIEQCEEDIVRVKTRIEHTPAGRLRKTLEADVKRMATRRAKEIRRLIAALGAHADLARRFELALSIPAIGERTALSIIIRLPEIELVNREQAAALAGLAPFVHNSGQFEGQTHIGGGRARLRRSLYMAALPGAHRWNPQLMALYRRMTAAGKSPKSALVACARKLLIFAITVVQRGTPWQDRPVAG